MPIIHLRLRSRARVAVVGGLLQHAVPLLHSQIEPAYISIRVAHNTGECFYFILLHFILARSAHRSAPRTALSAFPFNILYFTPPLSQCRSIKPYGTGFFDRKSLQRSSVCIILFFFCTPFPTKEWQQQCWREAVAVLASCTRAWCLVPAGHCIVVPQFYDSCYSSTPSQRFSWLVRVLLPPIMTGMTCHLFRSGLLLRPFSCKIRNH